MMASPVSVLSSQFIDTKHGGKRPNVQNLFVFCFSFFKKMWSVSARRDREVVVFGEWGVVRGLSSPPIIQRETLLL